MNEAVIVGEAVAGESAKVRNDLENLIQTVNKSTFDIAELLHTVKSKNFYSGWGYNTFQEYLETLDIKVRKAQYLARIVDVMNAVEIPREKYEETGIGKLREITSLEPGTTYKHPETGAETPMDDIIVGLVDKAKDMLINDLKQHVKVLKGLVGDDELVWVNYSVKAIVKEQVLNPALELARKQIGTLKKDEDGMAVDASDGACWEIIAVEFINDPANQFLAEKHAVEPEIVLDTKFEATEVDTDA